MLSLYFNKVYAFEPNKTSFELLKINTRKNNNENNILDWWNKTEVQNAKNNFINEFANFNKNWSKDWKDILLDSDI